MRRRHVALAGLLIIALTNAVALGGAAYNRAGEPESLLTLTTRELDVDSLDFAGENSGVSMQLRWRVPHHQTYDYEGYGQAAWLTTEKLAQLGFDVSVPTGSEQAHRHYERQPARDALVVLELAGSAYQRAVEKARKKLAKEIAAAAASPSDEKLQKAIASARENLAEEIDTNSRLFAIDAGLDHAQLRAAYPDRRRYAVVHGLIGLVHSGDKDAAVTGYLSEISASPIHVSKSFVSTLEVSDPPSWQADIAFGRRLEPWIVSVKR